MGALALKIGQYEAEQALSRPLQNVFGFGRAAAKRLARIADINHRTAEGLINGDHLPAGLTFLKLIATVPEFAAEVRRITGMHENLDPRLGRELSRLVQTYVEFTQNAEEVAALDRPNDAGMARVRGADAEQADEEASRPRGPLGKETA